MIAGRVLAPGGDPVVDIPVAVRAVADRRPTSGGSTTTDDSGEYRIAGLVAGRYVAFIETTNTSAVAQTDPGRTAYRVMNQQISLSQHARSGQRRAHRPLAGRRAGGRRVRGERGPERWSRVRDDSDARQARDDNRPRDNPRARREHGRSAPRTRARTARPLDQSDSAPLGDDRPKRPLRVYRRRRRHVPRRRDETGLCRDNQQRHARAVRSIARRRTDGRSG